MQNKGTNHAYFYFIRMFRKFFRNSQEFSEIFGNSGNPTKHLRSVTPLGLAPPGAALLQGRRGYYFWAVYLRGGCPLCCGYDCGCTKTRNFTHSCLLTRRSTTDVDPQSIVTASNECRKMSAKPHQFRLQLGETHENDENLSECCKMPEGIVIRHYKKPHGTA